MFVSEAFENNKQTLLSLDEHLLLGEPPSVRQVNFFLQKIWILLDQSDGLGPGLRVDQSLGEGRRVTEPAKHVAGLVDGAEPAQVVRDGPQSVRTFDHVELA